MCENLPTLCEFDNDNRIGGDRLVGEALASKPDFSAKANGSEWSKYRWVIQYRCTFATRLRRLTMSDVAPLAEYDVENQNSEVSSK